MRRAADTNVAVRLIVQDDPQQLARAIALMESGSLVFIPTVLLETEWILRSVFRLRRDQILAGLSALLALPNVEIADEARVVDAVQLYEQGLDFGDAMHLVGAEGYDEFVTFDKAFVRRSEKLGVIRSPIARLI